MEVCILITNNNNNYMLRCDITCMPFAVLARILWPKKVRLIYVYINYNVHTGIKVFSLRS